MNPRPLPRPAEDPSLVAADWVERLTARPPSQEDIAELRAWIAADPANRRAFEQARAIWVELPEAGLARRRPPLRLIAGGLSVCLAIGLFVILPRHDHQTGAGEVKQLALADGSKVWLDSDSAFDLEFDDGKRMLRLARGRMAVDVVRDSKRPFSVEVGDARVTDIGTIFSVDRSEDLDVAVAEGLVEVKRGNRTTRVAAGEAGGFAPEGVRLRQVRPADFAWRDGRILLDQVPLGKALAELDRYYDGRIALLDDEFAARRVSGTLFADRVEEGVATIARSEGLRVTRLPWLILVHREE